MFHKQHATTQHEIPRKQKRKKLNINNPKQDRKHSPAATPKSFMKTPPAMPSFNHDIHATALVLNTNTRMKIYRHTLDQKLLQHCRSAIVSGAASFELPFGQCRCDIDILAGCALLRFWYGRIPVSSAGVATTTIGASELWEFLLDLCPERLESMALNKLAQAPQQPRTTPWIAAFFAPQFESGTDRHTHRHLQELHKVLGWAIIEHISAQHQRN